MCLQLIPEAAVVLAGQHTTMGQQMLRQGMAAQRRDSLASLAHWAPLPLLPALALLASPSASNPAVRAYALRSLHTCDPFQVTPVAFIPPGTFFVVLGVEVVMLNLLVCLRVFSEVVRARGNHLWVCILPATSSTIRSCHICGQSFRTGPKDCPLVLQNKHHK